MTEKVISIEQSFDKVTFHITGEDNFLNTVKVELDVYELAQLILKSKNKNDMKKEFVWTDKMVMEFNKSVENYYNQGHSHDSAMLSFKKQNTKEEEKPTVNRCNYSDTHVYFHLSGDKPEIEITKERLAEVLISVENGEFDGKGDYWKFNQQEYLRFGEECFNSAREYNNKDQSSFSSSWIKYKSFSDYMNRIK